MKKIIDFVSHLECPSLDGIVYPNGRVQFLNVEINWKTPVNYAISVGSQSSIKELENKGELRWGSCAVLARLKDQKNNIEVLSGESDYGSDGFVATVDLSTQKLIWLAFFNDSNPFDKLEFDGKEVYARSTNNCLWKFNFKSPTKCTVKCDKI